MHRTWGGIVAGALFVLPSLFILIALSWIYIAFGDVPAVAGVLYGIKPAVTAIVAVRRVAHRLARAAQRRAVGDRRRGVRRDLRPRRAVSGHRARRGSDRLHRRPRRAGQVPCRRRPRRGRRRATDRRSSTTTRRRRRTRASRGAAFARVLVVGLALWGAAMGAARRARRLGGDARADGLVLHQGRAAHFRRRLRGAALRLPGRGRALRLAHRARR